MEDPGLIVATADSLCQLGKFDHVAEFLKANLRQGIVASPWVYEVLAIALRESNGSRKEIERAEIALADLAPRDASSYLKASKAPLPASRGLGPGPRPVQASVGPGAECSPGLRRRP